MTTTAAAKISPAMQTAITTAFADGTLDCDRRTADALIARGLATVIVGTTTQRNRYSYTAQTVYNARLGARLTDAGLALR
jgi:hypothetical protein